MGHRIPEFHVKRALLTVRLRFLFICFLGGRALSTCRGGAEVLGIGTGEGGIAAEAGEEAAFCGGNALPHEFSCMEQTAFLQIAMDGAPGFPPKQAHHVKFTDKKILRQSVYGNFLCQMRVDIA